MFAMANFDGPPHLLLAQQLLLSIPRRNQRPRVPTVHRRKLTLIVLALLLAPAVNGSWTGDFSSNQVVIDEGQLSGDLLAARYSSIEAANGANWNLSGSGAKIYTWELQSNITIGSPISREGARESTSSHGPFQGQVIDIRNNNRFSIVRLDSASIVHVNSQIVASSNSREIFDDQVPTPGGTENPRSEAVDVANSTEVLQRQNWGNMVVQGDFKIHIQEIDLNITDENGTYTYKSGYEETPYDDRQPALPVGHVGSTHYRDTYLYVTNGTLTMNSLSEGQLEYFIRDWTADAPNGIELQNTDGSLLGKTGNRGLDNSTVYLPGPVTLSNGTSQGNRLFYDAFTPSDTVYVDGQPFTNPPDIIQPPLAEPTDPDPDGATVQKWAPDWWIAGGFALFLIAVALVGIRFQKPFWYVRWQMRSGNHAFVVKNTPRFFSKASKRKKSVLMHSLALLGRGRFEEATEFIFSLLPRDRPDEPTWDYMAAMALAGSGEFTEAKDHLTRCLTAAPQFIAEVELNPLLIRLLSDSSEPGSEFT
jgi:hypothetical protein